MRTRRDAETVRVVEKELSGAQLPDERLTKRLRRIAAAVASRPERAFPRVFEDASQLEGAYRFFNNDRVRPEALLAAHAEQTRKRAAEAERVVVAHDTTTFAFGGEREQLGRLSGQVRGFLGHFALAVDAKSGPLGVVHCEALLRTGQPKRRKGAAHRDESNEALRWERGAAAAHAQLPDAVHVMDREADSYPLMHAMLVRGQKFVVRLAYRERRAEDGPIAEVVAGAAVVAERDVPLSPRNERSGAKERRRFPARRQRTARLQIRACGAELLRAHGRGSEFPERISVNVVRAIENDPPPGQTAVEWMLYTNLPIATPEEALAVVDAYRSRWTIEEFFKALKTGCAFEERQLESMPALLVALAVFVPIAWQLLRLRALGRDDPAAPGGSLLSPTQLLCLRGELGRRRSVLAQQPTAREVLLAVARLGGHLPNNGDPGWLTLGRGLQDLLMLERGYLLARESDQS